MVRPRDLLRPHGLPHRLLPAHPRADPAFGELESADVADLVRRMFAFIRDFEGEIPGAKPEECGNYHDNDLVQAKWWARRYMADTLEVLDEAHTHYPALLD